jgi:hypothetical protein
MKQHTACLERDCRHPNCATLPTAFWTTSEKRIYRGALDTIERETGHRPAFNPNAVEVVAGVAQLLTLTEKNYTIVRP